MTFLTFEKGEGNGGSEISYREVIEGNAPESLAKFWQGPRWYLTVLQPDDRGGTHRQLFRVGTDFEVKSSFGSVESAVVVDKGMPVFDRPLYREAPSVNVIAWGRDKNGVAKFAVIRQPRPHADDPELPGNDHAPIVFGQIVMGFLDKIVGKDVLESFDRAAVREVGEEAGARVVLGIERPPYPWHNPNPAFVATWSDLFFVEVDLEQIEALKHDRNEPIYSAEYVTAAELRRRVAIGKDESGAVYRMCTANSLWFIFFCCHPELWA